MAVKSLRRRMRGWIAGLSGVLLVGCAASGSGPGKGREIDFAKMQPFPSPQKLEKIVSTTRPDLSDAAEDAPANVSTWTMADDLPAMLGAVPYEGDNPDFLALSKIFAENEALRPTAAMLCYAREYGRFRVAHGGHFPGDIERFIGARCGVHLENIRIAYWIRDRPEGYEGGIDPRLHTETILSSFQNTPPDSHVGAWIEAGDDEVVIVAVSGSPSFEMEPMPLHSGATGSIDVRGKLPWPASWVVGVVTRGEFGFRHCNPIEDEVVEADEVALRCTVDKGEPLVRVEVVAAPEGRLLGEQMFSGLFSPDGSLPSTYEAPVYELPVDPGDRSNAARLHGINALRQRAGLGPIRLSETQSQAVAELVPHFLDPKQKKHQDDIALGMLAGWTIDEPIRDAEIATTRIHRAWDLERELAGAMSSPYFRKTVLSQDRDLLASATVDLEPQQTRAVVDLMYSVFSPRNFAEAERTFFDELDLQRMAAGLPPVIRVHGPNDVKTLQASAERIRTGESTPTKELDFLASHFAQLVQRTFRSLAFAPMRLEGWRPEFEDELFKHEHIAAAVTISYFKPKGAAWGQHIVLMVYTILEGPLEN